MSLQDCLPLYLREPTTTITRIAAGLSGAGVYRVEAAGQSFVLKVAADNESAADWRRTLPWQKLAADAGLAPRIVHIDEARRAVLTVLVVDRSFMVFYRSPHTHQAALTTLGQVVRRLHSIPVPADASMPDVRELLGQVWGGFPADFARPDFVSAEVERVIAATPPAGEVALVLGHNDLNPSNLVYDGETILLLDWATAGPMDAFYDLAVLSVFLRMDEGTTRGLLSAYAGRQCVAIPNRFLYIRRLAAALAGTFQLRLARQLNHPGATGAVTPAAALSLGEFYQQLLAGALSLGTAEGHWAFALALQKEGLAL